jgi:hypothetical protein
MADPPSPRAAETLTEIEVAELKETLSERQWHTLGEPILAELTALRAQLAQRDEDNRFVRKLMADQQKRAEKAEAELSAAVSTLEAIAAIDTPNHAMARNRAEHYARLALAGRPISASLSAATARERRLREALHWIGARVMGPRFTQWFRPPSRPPAPRSRQMDDEINDLTRASREAYGRYPMRSLFPGGLVRAIVESGREASRQQIIADLERQRATARKTESSTTGET